MTKWAGPAFPSLMNPSPAGPRNLVSVLLLAGFMGVVLARRPTPPSCSSCLLPGFVGGLAIPAPDPGPGGAGSSCPVGRVEGGDGGVQPPCAAPLPTPE